MVEARQALATPKELPYRHARPSWRLPASYGPYERLKRMVSGYKADALYVQENR